MEEIQKILSQALPSAEVLIFDPRNDGVHLEAVVVSAEFEGMPLLKQHRLVMNALKDHFDSASLHALQLKTYTPKKWREENHGN